MTHNCAAPASLPGSHQEAAQSLVDPQIVNSIVYRNKLLQEPRHGVHPDMLDFTTAFLQDLARRAIPLFPHSFVRTHEQQNVLFERRVTLARGGESPHNWGMAVDIVHFGRYWNLTNKEWAVIGLIGKEVARRRKIKVTWGGDWSFYDPAHWELADWKERLKNNEPGVAVSFALAFAQARASGLERFTWQGKEYTTELA